MQDLIEKLAYIRSNMIDLVSTTRPNHMDSLQSFFDLDSLLLISCSNSFYFFTVLMLFPESPIVALINISLCLGSSSMLACQIVLLLLCST